MYRFAAALLIFMSGCGNHDGNSDAPNNHGFGFAFDAVGSHGLRLRKPGSTVEDANAFETRAQTVGVCANITAPPPPYVLFVPKDTLGGQRRGLYESSPPLILLEIDAVYEHEALHYLLDVSTGNLDPGHTSPLWACTENISELLF